MDVGKVDGILLRKPNVKTVFRLMDDVINGMLDPDIPYSLGDVLDNVKSRPWKRSKGSRCLKSGVHDQDEEPPPPSFVLPEGHFILKSGPKL